MKHGLPESWADGICCTGVVVQADAETVAALFGSPICLYDGTAVKATAIGGAKAFALRPVSSDWTIVELPVQDQSEGDYLRPMFEDVLAVLGGEVEPGDIGSQQFERPCALAALLGKELSAATVAIWGSDEWPGLFGGAFFQSGDLLVAYSAFTREQIEAAAATRKKLFEENELSEEDDDDDHDPEQTVVFRGAATSVLDKPIEEVLDAEFKRFQIAFDDSDRLADWADAFLAHSPEAAKGVGAFWFATSSSPK